MNRKGQYFIIFAVVFGILILGTATHFNFISSKSTFNDLSRTCDNYRHEVFIITQSGLSNQDELQEIQKLTDTFIENKQIQILFIYGSSTQAIIQNNLSDYVLFTTDNNPEPTLNPKSKFIISGNNINITSPFNRIFNLTETRNFFSVIRMVKENEVYYC
jgi:hypothetical protein